MSFRCIALSAAAISVIGASGGPSAFAQDVVAAPSEYAPSDWTARTLPELVEALNAGMVTSEALVAAYLLRIEQIDQAGPELQSVLTINPDALNEARDIDTRRANGEQIGLLAGVPILLKDNIDTKDPMPTTAGALALAENYARTDAPLAAGIRAEDGIILGKTNLSQWANFRSLSSVSGWSALGGQVHNPHMLDRTPCGSSSGSGAAIAASLAAASVGTETNGSIICPSNVNGVVGFKPTVGLVPQAGIVPISSSQDTAGPMTKTVRGAAMLLQAMAVESTEEVLSRLSDTALQGTRIGVLRYSVGDNSDIQARFDAALAVLEAEGATLVEIERFDQTIDNYDEKSFGLLLHEFKSTLNAYLAATPYTVKTRTLADLIAFNEAHADKELALFDQSIFKMAEDTKGMDDPGYPALAAAVKAGAGAFGIDRMLREYEVDFLVSPSGPLAPRIDYINGDVWPDWSGAGALAAKAGYPHLSVPMGEVHGIPIGLSFFGTAGSDADVLAIGYDYEQASRLRPEPGYLPSADARPEILSAVRKSVVGHVEDDPADTPTGSDE